MRGRVLVGLAILVGLGCRGGSYRLADVSGQVTLNGKPLENAGVTFQPMGTEDGDPGPGSYGRTDASGRYHLQVVRTKEKGAVVGTHRVSISTQGGGTNSQGEDAPLPPEKLPFRYNAETTLTCKVPKEGTTTADFPLTAP